MRQTFLPIAFAGACIACSPSPDSGFLTEGAGGSAGSSAGGSGGSVSSGSSTSVGGTGFGGGFISVGGEPSNGGGSGGECASSVHASESIVVEVVTYEPIALFIMVDRSGSMITGFPAPASPDSWNNATAAISAFVNDPASAGVDIGLGTFPYGPNNTASCADGADCGTPVVPIAPLPGNAGPMTTAMSQQGPNTPITLTPTECALRGMINQCAQFMAQSATGEQCVAVLVTDGTPTQCDTNQANLVNIVAAGAAQGVQTFALALPGANIAALNEYAQAGGTDCDPNGPNFACDATAGAQAFIDALNTIRSSVVTQQVQTTTLECSWGIPEPNAGDTLDPAKVNVEFSADGVAAQSIGKVPSEAECANFQGGWFYDDPANPTTISVCPDTCGVITAAGSPRIDIQLGCETRFSPPR